MRKFQIERDYYEEDVVLYRRKNIEIQPGLTVLVGCNGSGKTTLLHQLRHELKNNDITYIDFDNLTNGGSYARSEAGFVGDISFLATSVCSSEGENIIMNIGKVAASIGSTIRENRDSKELWILLDAIDSGLSVDNVIEIKNLFNLIIEDAGKNNTNVYIVISANEYELARGEQCFDVYNGKYITFEDYEAYRKFIIKSRKTKDKRYGTTE